jgi:hypothetical protein
MLPGQSIEGSPEPEMVQPTPEQLQLHYDLVKDYDKAIAAIKRAPPTFMYADPLYIPRELRRCC